MHLIKLDAISSTNSFLRELVKANEQEDFTVVITKNQTGGRGQMGTQWLSQPDKNLTFSVYKKLFCLPLTKSYYISMATSIAIYRALEKFNIPDLKIKWPNDILSQNCKICGILIENVIKEGQLVSVIAGVGLNVNQTDFGDLIHVSSLKKVMGTCFSIEEVFGEIMNQFKIVVKQVEAQEFAEIKETYESLLFRKDKPSTFTNGNGGEMFMGFIRKVSDDGKLIVELEDRIFKAYDLKEIKLLY